MTHRKHPRDAHTRRISIVARLRRTMATYHAVPSDQIVGDTCLGTKFEEILSLVSEQEGRPSLRHFGPMRADSTFTAAVEFLLTAIQA